MTKRKAQQQQQQVVQMQEDDDDDKTQYCEFCGASLTDLFPAGISIRRKYCSARCRSVATSRRTSARLGIPPTRRAVSRLSNPLYFN